MSTINVTRTEAEAAMPGWVVFDPVLRDLWHSSLAWRAQMCAADGNMDAEDTVRALAHDSVYVVAKHTITLAEAGRRWRKDNLRQNAKGRLDMMWKDGEDHDRGTWMTTTYAMRRLYGPDLAEAMAAADALTEGGEHEP